MQKTSSVNITSGLELWEAAQARERQRQGHPAWQDGPLVPDGPRPEPRRGGYKFTGDQHATVFERWAAKVRRLEGGCWRWAACIRDDGYGSFTVVGGHGPNTIRLVAHKYAFEVFRFPVPEGLELDHLCRNRWCVNPFHLQPVTQLTNLMRGESFCANNARKTHCMHGHEFTPENTLIVEYPNRAPCRRCRKCHARRQNEFYRRTRRKALG